MKSDHEGTQSHLIGWLRQILIPCSIRVETSSFESRESGFMAFPNCYRAKLLLPLGNGLRGYWRGLDLYPAFLPVLVVKKLLTAAGGLFEPVLRRTHSISLSGGDKCYAKTLYQFLSEKAPFLDRVKNFAVRTGSQGSGFKLIFQFQDPRGDPICYIKVGDPTQRGPFLLNERMILDYLKGHGDVFVVPKSIGFKQNDLFSALEISPIRGMRYFPSPNQVHFAKQLAELCKITASVTPKDAGDELYSELTTTYQKDDEMEVPTLVGNCLEYLSSKEFPRPLTHRDLAGWNVFLCENKKIGILDWEFAKPHHLPFQDLFHYLLHTTVHNTKLLPVEAYQRTFKSNGRSQKMIHLYADVTHIEDPKLVACLRVAYLWDWYTFERQRADEESSQGKEYLEILNWLAENEDRI
jgi:hypothetical protein